MSVIKVQRGQMNNKIVNKAVNHLHNDDLKLFFKSSDKKHNKTSLGQEQSLGGHWMSEDQG